MITLDNELLKTLQIAVEVYYDIQNDTVLDEMPHISDVNSTQKMFTREELNESRQNLDKAISDLQNITLLQQFIKNASEVNIK